MRCSYQFQNQHYGCYCWVRIAVYKHQPCVMFQDNWIVLKESLTGCYLCLKSRISLGVHRENCKIICQTMMKLHWNFYDSLLLKSQVQNFFRWEYFQHVFVTFYPFIVTGDELEWPGGWQEQTIRWIGRTAHQKYASLETFNFHYQNFKILNTGYNWSFRCCFKNSLSCDLRHHHRFCFAIS